MLGEAVTKVPISPLEAAVTLKLTGVVPVLVSVMFCVLEAVLVKEAPANRTRGSRVVGVMFTLGAVSRYVCRKRLGVF